MSDLIIKIGDDALDLSADQTVAITKQAAKVGDFSAILADGTNEVTIPLTPRNRTILDNAHLITSDSDRPYTRLDATLIQEGYETIQNGYAIIKSSMDNFSLQVVGGNGGFFDLIKDLDLRSLDLSDYGHFWTNQECFDRRNETEGVIYAVFEQSASDDVTKYTMNTYGTNQYEVQTGFLLPSFYVKTLVEKIFDEQGYTFVTDLTTEDIYDKAVVFRAETPNRGNNMSYHDCTVRNDADFLFTGFVERNFPTSTIDANTSAYLATGQVLSTINTDGVFPLTDSCRVTVDFEIIVENVSFPPPSANFYVAVSYTTAGGIETVNLDEITLDLGLNTYTASVTIDVSMYNDEIYFYSFCASDLWPLTIKEDSTFTVTVDSLLTNSAISSDTFPFNYISGALPVPDMKQADFLKEIARIYQWVYDTDELTKTVTAKRFDNIVENKPSAIDLSDKIDANNIKINFGIDGFAQTNALRYKEDDVTKYDAVGYINVADTTLKPEKDYVKMEQLAATSTRLRFDTVNAPYVPIFEDEGLPTEGQTDRIFLVRRETFPYNTNFNRGASDFPTNDVTFAYFAEAGNEDSLDFPTLIDRFYQAVIDMNTRGKTVEAKVNLNIKDVENYDPFIPVYISHLGSYFYWEKLGNYVKDKLTKCTFVKI